MGACLSSKNTVKEEKKETPSGQQFEWKIVMIGNPDVGKTTMFNKYTDGCAPVELSSYEAKVKKIQVHGTPVTLTVSDIAGQERFRTITSSFYEDTKGVIIVYDICTQSTFNTELDAWIEEARRYAPDSAIILVGNKIDRITEREVKAELAQEKARKTNLLYIETSALTGKNVEEAFDKLIERIWKMQTNNINDDDDPNAKAAQQSADSDDE